MVSRVAPLDICECLLFVDVNEHVAFDRFENSGAFDLARLEDNVTGR